VAHRVIAARLELRRRSDRRSHPVQVAKSGKVVYSMHDYSWCNHLAGQSQAGTWWASIQAWLKEYDVDWCWWALNPTHGQSCTPGTSTIQYNWGAPEPYGLLTLDWTSVGYPAVITMLQALMQPRTGPGIT
jgi:hypothetical protein